MDTSPEGGIISELTIWQGGVKVFPVEVSNIPSDLSATDKFNTCINRSAEQETRVIRTCCSSREQTGYACIKLGIFPLPAERCKECLHYEPKPVN